MKLVRFLWLVLTEILFSPIKICMIIYVIGYSVYAHFAHDIEWEDIFDLNRTAFQRAAEINNRFIDDGEVDLNDFYY